MKYKEKIGDQWYYTTVIVNGSMKDIPLLGRIFGSKQVTCDQKWDEENIVELHSIIYKGKIYIYQEIITVRVKIDGPNDDHSIDAIRYDQEFYKKILVTVNPEPKKDHWTNEYFKTKEKTCINCDYGLEPRKCFNIDIIALQGGYTKANYVKLSKENYNFIQLDKNCTGFKKKTRSDKDER